MALVYLIPPTFVVSKLDGANGRNSAVHISLSANPGSGNRLPAVYMAEFEEWPIKFLAMLCFVVPYFFLMSSTSYIRWSNLRSHALEIAVCVRYFGEDYEALELREGKSLCGYGDAFSSDKYANAALLSKKRAWAMKAINVWWRRWAIQRGLKWEMKYVTPEIKVD